MAEVTVYGVEAHSAHPQKGRSAIYRAARFISAIEEYSSLLAREQHSFFTPSFTTLNIGTIQGGTAKNIVPGRCKFQLEWRPIPGQAADTVPAAVSKIAENLRSADSDFQFTLQVLRQQAGFEIAEGSEFVRSIERITGRAATSIPFSSEANLLAAVAEEIIVFGPGDMQTAHSRRECVPLSELDEAVSCLLSLIKRATSDAT
jgi:acetylornithine deacetylase